MEPGEGLLPERILAQRHPRRARRASRVSGTAAGALTAMLAVGWAWPGAASAAPQGTSPAPPSWLLSRSAPTALPLPSQQTPLPTVAPLRHMTPADLVAVSATTLSAKALAAIRGLHGVRAAEAVDAAQVRVNGKFVAVLGVDPSHFRGFAAKPTARDTAFWRSVAAGKLGISYTMGKQDKLPTGSSAVVAGRHVETLSVGRLGTVGIGGIDAVVSDTAADSLGLPERNAFVISAPKARFTTLAKRIRKLLPHSATVDVIASQAIPAGAAGTPASPGPSSISGLVSVPQVRAMLSAALSRVGDPYVWGAAGPNAFDCSGLVQWSFRQAGIVMPRVAADQARTGPSVPVSQLQPGDLLFYHTDPTAPDYISHVAIYLGGGRMLQAPETGMDVEVVPVDLGSEFAGAIDVSPATAAQVAATSV